MKSFDQIWMEILDKQKNTFHTIEDIPFLYKVNEDEDLIISKVDKLSHKISKENFKKAYSIMPVDSPFDLVAVDESILGYRYIWAILNTLI